MATLTRGRLIVFEGIEGCGKTTQLHRTRDWLVSGTWHPQGCPTIPIITTREPGGTPLGQKLRQLLLTPSPLTPEAELLLYAADRTQHVAQALQPQLAAGALILCDRYTDSTVAYQGYGRGLDLELIHQLNQVATAGLESDVTLWLDVDVAVGRARLQERGAPDRMEQVDLAFHQRVQEGFAALARAHPHRIRRVEADGDVDSVSQAIQKLLLPLLHQWHGHGSL